MSLRRTGASLPLDGRLVRDTLVWLGFFLIVRVRGTWSRIERRPVRLWATPQIPAPWYLIRAAAAWSGMRFVEEREDADVVLAFEDAATGPAVETPGRAGVNLRCTDITKTHVARVFEQVFGYPLALDPETWTGPAVEKNEGNGLHDGRVVACPTPRRPGFAYQRLIDTVDAEGLVVDLRTPCVDGRPVVVWRKRRPAATRFDIYNVEVVAVAPEAVFRPDEILALGRFCAAMALDWGGLDVLRDRTDGRLYVVDVNKTDVGPVLALSLRDKLEGTAALARALQALIARLTAAA